jgi:hypothetical protein
MGFEVSFFTTWLSAKTAVPAEDLGYSGYDFLTRDAKTDGGPDGFHTQAELRQVIQREIDEYERSGQDPHKWNRLQESRKMLDAMVNYTKPDGSKGIEQVDYLPENLRDIDEYLRPRAAELMQIAVNVNRGSIDQSVIDYARRRYETKLADGKISQRARDKAIGEINTLAEHLREHGEGIW